MKISTSVPAFIETIEENQSRYTKARLKIFYKGLTADGRLFTSEFSDELLKSISYTPVVGYFDEERDDFTGHNAVQYVYGVVPDDSVNNLAYEEDEESGRTFAVVDVILFTERDDNIGDIARKIVGKQHSLELNPATLKYKVNRDKDGRFHNIEFLHGEFIGLSVLGDDEHPAFAGSGFFSDESFDSKKCVETFENFLHFLKQTGGSIEVFNFDEYAAKTAELFKSKQTMQEFIEKIYAALQAKELYGYVVENTTEQAIVCVYNSETDRCEYRKYSISEVDYEIVLGDYEEVFIKYITQAEIDAIDDNKESEPANDDENKQAEAQVQEEQSTEGQMSEPAASVGTSALSDSERLELDSYRRAQKQAKVAEYEGDISHEAFSRIMDAIDSYAMEELEAELNKEYRNAAKATEKESAKTPTTFSTITTIAEYCESNPVDVVNKYKN